MAENATPTVHVADPVARFSLRARGDLGPLNAVLGFGLPTRIGARAASGPREALCVGPDEWVLLTEHEDAPEVGHALGTLSARHPHSLVDISGREVTLVLEGPGTERLLTIGLARDPRTIRPGEGRRTLFDTVTVTLWRDGAERVRLDVWRSFAPHVHSLLEMGCGEVFADGPRGL